ncbi:5'-nucleotidase C-terminal domain-containing protein [Paenibacillus hunanensis]|uniref:5'-nucleotidase C-terminal domain-containing protein n=1 Tax=Paenibacillus hunanensis TaxID=539262 RepID=UPI002A6A3426|nr:5'-nucleotidase C-terminal domain-containing protein [Paenibacillus hunanensis]WPP40426.1 5'-nucleotidase C-terminal domain-containing protein [Paenibacillus hunanensis]
MFKGKTVFALAMSAFMTFNAASLVSAAAPATLTVDGIKQQMQQDAGTGTHITLLHTNDVHAHAVEESPSMGLAKIAGLADLYRAANPNTLLLDDGDAVHGTSFATLVRGESMIQVMNKMGYAAMEPGNHEFDYGYERLLELAKMANFPVISSNIIQKDTGKAPFEPYIIREVDGVKVGIFGLETPETAYKTNPNNVKNVEFTDPTEAARKMVTELKGKVDVIVALGHIGMDQSTEQTSIDIVKAVPGIDVFIDGHSHTLLTNGQTENGTLIASTGEYGEHLGVVDLWVDKGAVTKKEAYTVDEKAAANVTPNAEVASLIDSIKASQEPILNEVVAQSPVALEGAREKVRAGETNLGDLITDAMRSISGADAAITNGGGIRASIDAGPVTKGEIVTVLPFGNLVISIQVTGKDILAALENGATDYPTPKGAFSHVSGITYKIDPSKPAGSRVHSVTVGGKALDLNKTYNLATNDFMVAGGDEYKMFVGKQQTGTYGTLDEALIEYMQKNGSKSLTSGKRIVEAATPATTPATGTPTPGKPATTPAKPATPAKPPVVADPIKPVPAPPVSGDSDVYVVKSGDTLYSIAKNHGTTWKVLRDLNDLKNPHWIYPGQKLELPAAS